MKSISVKAGLDRTALHGMLKRGYTPSVENFLAIAEAAGVDPGWLLTGDDRFRVSVPISGIADGVETWKPANGAAMTPIAFEVGDHDTIGLEVRGDGMQPVYRNGDFLLCHRHIGKHVDNLIGRDCAVLTKDGRGYVKILARGSRPGLYTLRSYNPLMKDVENVSVVWAAPIVWVKRAG